MTRRAADAVSDNERGDRHEFDFAAHVASRVCCGQRRDRGPVARRLGAEARRHHGHRDFGEPTAIVGFLHTDAGGFNIASNVYSGLIGLDNNFNPTRNLADSWDMTPDGRTYEFNLNRRARLHDGKPVTAHDCEFTFNEVISKFPPIRDSWRPNVEFTRAVDDHTFVIQLKQAFPPMMALLAYELRSGALILPKNIYTGTDASKNPANDKPIGSGPLNFVRWVKGRHVELVRNPDYFMEGKPYLDRLIIQFIPDAGTRILAFERGEVDFIDYTAVPHNEIKRLEANPEFKVLRGLDAIAVMGMWLINVRHPVLKDVRVRQALYYGIDDDQIADKSLFGAGKPARGDAGASGQRPFRLRTRARGA